MTSLDNMVVTYTQIYAAHSDNNNQVPNCIMIYDGLRSSYYMKSV